MQRMVQQEANPLVSKQIELETLYNKNQTLKRIAREFIECEQFNFIEYIEAQDIDSDFGIDLLVQMALHKRAKLPVLVGILKKHFEPATNACQLAADMLVKCAMADLVDWNSALETFIVKFPITAEVQKELDMYQFPLPMVVEPKELKDNRSTPYMSLKDGSVILRKNHHEDDVVLDHLNRVNRYRFAINNQVAAMVRNSWRNLDKPKEGETKFDFERRKRAFDKYNRTAKEVMAKITELGNCFYLTHKVDKRGRIYSQGYHVNYQGSPWNKAVVELFDKEIIP